MLDAAPLGLRLQVLRECGSFFLGRYRARGEDNDLRRAVAAAERALPEAPARSEERQLYLSDLGIALRARFERWGDPTDIDRGAACQEEILREMRPDDPRLPLHAENLANVLWSRTCASARGWTWSERPA